MSGMTAYFFRRLLLIPFTFVAITLMVYTVLRFVPGGPIEQAETAMKLGAMQGEAGSSSSGGLAGESELQLDDESIEALQRYYALDRPVLIGYLQWLGLWSREHYTRIQKKTVERRPEIFDSLKKLKDAQLAAQDSLQKHLDAGDMIYFRGKYYRRIEDGAELPPEIAARSERFLDRGYSGRDDHLAYLHKKGFTIDGGLYFEELDSVELASGSVFIDSADEYVRRIALAGLKLEDIRKKYGYTIRDGGGIYYVENRFSGIVQLDFGRSYTHGKPVVELIVSKMEVSIQFGLTGYILTWLVCIPLGVFKALKHRSMFDTGTSLVVFLGYAMPGFVVCLVLLSTVAINVDWLPLGGYKPDNIEEMGFLEALFGRFRHMLIPVTGYMVGGFATMTILMKNSLLDNLGADYVRTGFAKGLSERRVVFVHALRNSMIPITAGIGHAIGLLFAGSFLIETTCNIDGMGLLGFEAIIQRDYPIILATLVIGVLIRLFGNIISDIVWAIIDPRIRFG